MTLGDEHLSAYLDGELGPDEVQAVEAWLEGDPNAQAQLERLMAADGAAKEAFENMLSDPVPLGMAAAIRAAPEPTQAPSVHHTVTAQTRGLPGWAAIAASVGFLAVGGLGGYTLGTANAPEAVQTAGWLSEVAAYHAVYETQNRYLIEFTATNTYSTRNWLGSTVGVPFSLPNFSDQGLRLLGARLLVAGGDPVAQLVYEDASGAIFALCFKDSAATEDFGFTPQTIGAYDMVSWRDGGKDFVVVGPEGLGDLGAMAQAASVAI